MTALNMLDVVSVCNLPTILILIRIYNIQKNVNNMYYAYTSTAGETNQAQLGINNRGATARQHCISQLANTLPYYSVLHVCKASARALFPICFHNMKENQRTGSAQCTMPIVSTIKDMELSDTPGTYPAMSPVRSYMSRSLLIEVFDCIVLSSVRVCSYFPAKNS